MRSLASTYMTLLGGSQRGCAPEALPTSSPLSSPHCACLASTSQSRAVQKLTRMLKCGAVRLVRRACVVQRMATTMIRALTTRPVAPRAGLGRCLQARFDRANRTPPFPWLLTVVAVLCFVGVARAELPELVPPSQPVGPSALDGGRYVGSALPPARSLRVAGSLGYGYTGDVLGDDDRHHRLAGELYGALVVHPALQLSLGSEARLDRHRGEAEGTDQGLLVSSQITSRHA